MTRLLFTIISLLLFTISNAQEYRYVWATNGLILRTQAASSATKVLTIAYGEKVKIIDNNTYGDEFSAKEPDGLSVTARWKNIEYRGSTGYIFEGYLSRLPAFDEIGASLSKNRSKFDYYLKEQIGYKEAPYNIKYEPEATTFNEESKCGFEQLLKQDMTYIQNYCGEGGGSEEFFIPNFTLREGYLLCKKLYLDKDMIGVYHRGIDEIEIRPREEEAGCYITIEKFGKNGIRIKSYCGC